MSVKAMHHILLYTNCCSANSVTTLSDNSRHSYTSLVIVYFFITQLNSHNYKFTKNIDPFPSLYSNYHRFRMMQQHQQGSSVTPTLGDSVTRSCHQLYSVNFLQSSITVKKVCVFFSQKHNKGFLCSFFGPFV